MQAVDTGIYLTQKAQVVAAMLVDLAVEDSAQQSDRLMRFVDGTADLLALFSGIESAVIIALQLPSGDRRCSGRLGIGRVVANWF